MSAINKLLTISGLVILPWAIIRLTNVETKIMEALKQISISDASTIIVLILPPLLFYVAKWLCEPATNTHKSYSGGSHILIKFRE